MDLSALIPADFVHPDVDNDDIGDCQTKQCDLALNYSLIFFPFDGIESLSVDDVELAIIFEPYSFSASLPAFERIKDWEMSLKCRIYEGTLARTLGAEYGDVGGAGGVLPEQFTR